MATVHKALGARGALLASVLFAALSSAAGAAECDGAACILPSTDSEGKATGGGQIAGEPAELAILRGTAAGGRASFGFNARFTEGDSGPSGHLTFIDHGTRKDVKSTSIESFTVVGSRATFSGQATVNGTPGVGFRAEVEDKGEPGSGEANQDTFAISLRDGYAAAGVLVHGNIQVRAGGPPEDGEPPPPIGPFSRFFGSIHNHTAYSDGEGRPEDAFAAGKAAGLNYLFLTEHSEWLEFPFKASEDCLDPRNTPGCEAAPPPGKTEWEDIKDQGELASDPTIPYLGLRGFEWSSPTLGHVNVLLPSNYIGNGPEAPTMDAFWSWFLLDKELGGGSDGLATFNHPSRERHPLAALRTFEDFRYVAEADPRTVGLEVFNRGDDYSACFVRALGKGWHLGAIGAADDHDNWGRPDRSRTALVVDMGRFGSFTPQAAREALRARRFYATFDHNLRLTFKADGEWMGSRLKRQAGQAVTLLIEAQDPDLDDKIRRIEIYGSGIPEPTCDRDQRYADGVRKIVLRAPPLAAADFDATNASFQVNVVPPAGKESWYFAKVIGADGQVAYVSPVWVRVPEGPPPEGTWMAADLHVHTVYSHDVCNPETPGSEQCLSEPWTAGFTPAQQIALAESRGLGFLALTDHNTTDHLSDAGFTGYSSPVVLVPGQELSLKGHANVLGYSGDVQNRRGSASPAEVQAIIDEVHAGGGLFSINHPEEPRWRYGREPGLEEVSGFDSIEFWNINWAYQDRFFPFLNPSNNPDALRYWQSWLDRGVRVAGVGGSDSHWILLSDIQGVGQPSTWVFAGERTLSGVLDGIRSGRVFVASQPPNFAGARLFLEADADRDGVYGTIAGGSLHGGGPKRFRVRVENGAGNLLRLVTNGGRVLATAPVVGPSQEIRFTLDLPVGAWLRADLFPADPETEMTAVSSPIYVEPT